MSHYCHETTCIKKVPDEKDYCPEHELHYPEEVPHLHKYTIPVAYERLGAIYKVTALRCECGEETVRE